MINQTKNYNELLVERKVTKEGKLINRKPSFVVFMAERKDYRMDLIPTILQKIENNKAAQLGEPKITRIRDRIFSDKTIKSILNQIIQAINDSSKEKANEGIEAFVKQTKKFQKIYQENKYANNCKTYN